MMSPQGYPGRATTPLKSTARGTILLVDDEPSVRQMLRDVLTGSGYRVLEASDGESALAVAASEPAIELLITDVRLPGVDGLTLAERLCDGRPELKVIFMSGYSEDILTDPARLGPGRRVLEKPFRTARLIEMLGSLLV